MIMGSFLLNNVVLAHLWGLCRRARLLFGVEFIYKKPSQKL